MPFGLMQICSRQICAGIQTPGMACKHYIHVIWIPAIHAGMTLFLKQLYNQEILSFLRGAIDDEVVSILANFLVFQHEVGGIAAQFGFSGLEQRTINQKRRDGSTAQ